MKITIDIAEELACNVTSRPQSVMAEVRLAAATAFYLQGKIPLATAARMAEVSITCFQERLTERAAPREVEPVPCEFRNGQESEGARAEDHADWCWD